MKNTNPRARSVARFLCLPPPVIAIAIAFAGACVAPDEPGEPTVDVDSAARRPPPTPGSAGIGDSLFDTLGNGGYDVLHYDLHLRYETASPAQAIDGTVTIEARATQSLSRFNLDFDGDSVGSVAVDDCAATWVRDGEELIITPADPIRRGERFEVKVSHFTATPVEPDPNVFLDAPFFITPDGSAWAGQPDNAHRIFPSNDHPRDLASFDFRIDVPAGTTAVANGRLRGRHTHHGRTVWRYQQRQPMATELAQVAVGAFTVIERGRHHGVDVRDVVPTRLVADLDPKLATVIAHLDWLVDLVGPYPFDTYGTLPVDAPLGFALETQTLSLFDDFIFGFPAEVYESIMVHELAHQWFGNSVAPANWSDVWMNEGHATWYEVTYFTPPDSPEFLEFMQFVYEFSDIFRTDYGAVGAPRSGHPDDLFNLNVYYGGALVLYALHQQVGDADFRRIERRWVRDYRGRSATSADFIELASRVSGQDLTEFLNAWLYGDTTPPMPGHPDWVVIPAASAAARSATSADLPARFPLPGAARHAAGLHKH